VDFDLLHHHQAGLLEHKNVKSYTVEIYVTRVNVSKIYLLIKAVFDDIAVLFVNTGNTMGCQMSNTVICYI
jgi:hypothetical protein